ncbi:hypothetical protein P8C59_005988 [Phyllachora maydis]|uniref:Uncharacterized protein n=1 Tax=Phyllachora maydis TaxID=1825666 RepID=A0AAD9I793_9PEZI|nr:hypothetical protein P8C59_005988 [Phyllachora maydis]
MSLAAQIAPPLLPRRRTFSRDQHGNLAHHLPLLHRWAFLLSAVDSPRRLQIVWPTAKKKTRRTMAAAQVNGNVSHSAFFEHLLNYPVINDSISTFKSNPYGQKSIELGDSAYKTFAQPVDDLGEKTLSKVDEKFPVVKKPSQELYNDAKTIVFFPVRVGQIGKEHVFNTYHGECKKVGGDNLLTYGKALLTTALILTTETYTTLSNFLNSTKKDVKASVDEKTNGN